MRTIRRRPRTFDPLATPAGVRSILDQLRERRPDLIPRSEKQFLSLLNATRHIESLPANDTKKGRPSQWDRDRLLEVSRNLRAVLQRATSGRVSLSSFVGVYLRILHFPSDVSDSLAIGKVNLQEAVLLASLSHRRLGISQSRAQRLRQQILANHLMTKGSQNALRARVKEVLVPSDLISTQTVAEALRIEDELIEVDPSDQRHLFYETIRTLFYAMREIKPEDVDDNSLDEFNHAADGLAAIIKKIQLRRQQKDNPPVKFHL